MQRSYGKVGVLTFLFLLFIVLFNGCGVKGLSNYNSGVEHQQNGRAEMAEQEFKIALQKNPYLAEAHLNLGLIYLNRGWLDGAEASTKRGIEIFEITKKTLVKGSTY